MRHLSCCTLLSLATACAAAGAEPSGPVEEDVAESYDVGADVRVMRPIQLTERARFPEDHPDLEAVEATSGTIRLRYALAPMDVELRPGLVIAGARAGGYLRTIVDVVWEDDATVTLATEPASLGDLILDGRFIARVPLVPVGSARDGAPGDEVGASREGLRSGVSFLGPGARVRCTGGGGLSATVDPTMDGDLDTEIDIDVDGGVRLHPTFGYVPYGEVNWMIFRVSGYLELGVDVELPGVAVTCSHPIEAVSRVAQGVGRLNFVSVIPTPIPLVFTHSLEPTASVSLSASAGGETRASASVRWDFSVGREYERGVGWTSLSSLPAPVVSSSLEHDPTDSVSATVGLRTGLLLKTSLYDAAGPTLSLGPGLSATFETDGECVDLTRVDGTLGGSIGVQLQVPLLDIAIASVSYDLPSLSWPLLRDSSTDPACFCDPIVPLCDPSEAPMPGCEGLNGEPLCDGVVALREHGCEPNERGPTARHCWCVGDESGGHWECPEPVECINVTLCPPE